MERIFALRPTLVALGNKASLNKVGNMDTLAKALKI
jgi:hypothetical protein